MKTRTIDHVFSGAFGGLAFIIFYLFIYENPILAVVAGVGVYLLSLLGFSYFDPGAKRERERNEDFNNLNYEITEKLKHMKNLKNKINTRLVKQIDSAANRAYEKILTNENSYAFMMTFSGHLDTALNVFSKYRNLLKAGIHTERIEKTQKQIEKMLEQILDIFQSQLEKIHNEDIMYMEAELSAVQEILDMETALIINNEEREEEI